VLAIDVNRDPRDIVEKYIQVYFVSIPCGECVVVALENLLTVSILACLVILNLVVSSSVLLNRVGR
jgi:hypothetical protein